MPEVTIITPVGLGFWHQLDASRRGVDVEAQYYPSLSNTGRQRVQLDVVKRELLKDLFLALNLNNTYDSNPPNPAANTNDVGLTLSVGWSH